MLEKLEEYKILCTCPEHNPPSHFNYDPGKYRWTCPACGAKQEFEVPLILHSLLYTNKAYLCS